jgi:serine O-acetyltransferase
VPVLHSLLCFAHGFRFYASFFAVCPIEAGVTQRDARTPVLLTLLRSALAAKSDRLYGALQSRSFVKTVLTGGTSAMLLFPLMQSSQRLGLNPVTKILNNLNVVFDGSVTGRHAQLGPGCLLIYSTGIVIDTAVRAGCDVRIDNQAMIGAERGLSWQLGDDLFISAGPRVLGAIAIGWHVSIGASAVILTDVPDSVTAAGVPAWDLTRSVGHV